MAFPASYPLDALIFKDGGHQLPCHPLDRACAYSPSISSTGPLPTWATPLDTTPNFNLGGIPPPYQCHLERLQPLAAEESTLYSSFLRLVGIKEDIPDQASLLSTKRRLKNAYLDYLGAKSKLGLAYQKVGWEQGLTALNIKANSAAALFKLKKSQLDAE